MKPALRNVLFFIFSGATLCTIVLYLNVQGHLGWLLFIGGWVLIIFGLQIALKISSQSLNEAISDHYDPNFEYDRNRFKRLELFSRISSFCAFWSIFIARFWTTYYVKEGMFWLVFGIVSLLLSWGVFSLAYRKTQEMRVVTERALDTNGRLFFTLVMSFMTVFIIITNTFPAENRPKKKLLFVAFKKEYNRINTLQLQFEDKARWVWAPYEVWENVSKGDIVQVRTKRGIFGFERIIDMQKHEKQ